MSSFTHLHLHDMYSFLDGFGQTKEYIARCQKLGFGAYCATNHGGVWGWARAAVLCKEANFKFVPGVELFLDSAAVDKTQRRVAWEHLTVLAMNQTGYQNLLAVVSKAGASMVRNRPIATYPDLFAHAEGLIVLSGCSSGRLVRALAADRTEEAIKVLRAFQHHFRDRFYIEIQPNPIPDQVTANPLLVELAHTYSVPVVATNDVHYILATDAPVHEVMLCVQMRDSMDNPQRWKFSWDGFYLATPQEMIGWFAKHHPKVPRRVVEAGLAIPETIVRRVTATIPVPEHFILPPVAKDPVQTFLTMVRHGFKARGLATRSNHAAYEARLKYEVQMIVRQNLVTYFLIVADLMQWARQRMLAGPGRGSSGGSLVCYVLRITEIDPLVHNTLFERFITEERADLPDIDMDFPSSHREEVINYLRTKYGEAAVSAIVTYAEFRGKMALRDVARVFQVPRYEIDSVAPLIIYRSGGDSRVSMTVEDAVEESPEFKAFATKYPRIVKTAIRLEGITRQIGKHAAGLAIVDRACQDYFPTFVKDGMLTSQWDKDDLERMKILKVDVLGIDILDTFARTTALIADRHGKTLDLFRIPLDDPEVYRRFSAGETVGVFQFESKGIASWCHRIGAATFRDVVDLNALYRPGTLAAGWIPQYEARKHGREQWGYAHPYLKPILDPTYGIPLYQEQIMLIFNKLAGVPWKTADTVRKVISKSQGLEKFNAYLDVFVKGCAQRGIDADTARRMFESIRTFGAYGFNLSHSVAYSMIAYLCMWLKVHYPLEYLATLISNERSSERVAVYLKEAQRVGIEVLPPSVDRSQWSYAIEGTAIRSGFKDVKRVGQKAAGAIVARQPYGSWQAFLAHIERRTVNSRVIKALIAAGATQDFAEHLTVAGLMGPAQLRSNPRWGTTGIDILLNAHRADNEVFPRVVDKLATVPEYGDRDLLRLKATVFPMPVGKHPITLYADLLQHYPQIATVEAFNWKPGYVAGMVTNIGTSNLPHFVEGRNMPLLVHFFTLDGEHDYLNVIVKGGPQVSANAIALKVKEYAGLPVVISVDPDARRYKVYCTGIRLLESLPTPTRVAVAR